MRQRPARRAAYGAAIALFAAFQLLPVLPAMAEGPDGAALADSCTSCHGVNGRSQGSIPSIGGVDKGKLLAALQGFKANQGSPTIMNRIVRGYSDAELEALATYFSSVKAQ